VSALHRKQSREAAITDLPDKPSENCACSSCANCPSCHSVAWLRDCRNSQIRRIIRAVPPRQEGRFGRSSPNVRAGCDGRGTSTDEGRCARTAKACGPGAPWLALSLRTGDVGPLGPDAPRSQATVTMRSRTPGRARTTLLTPLRREGRVAPVEPVVNNSCAFYTAHEAAGATSIRSSLRPLFFGGTWVLAKLGRIAPREREFVAAAFPWPIPRDAALRLLGMRLEPWRESRPSWWGGANGSAPSAARWQAPRRLEP
jgi:hypothetical protein